MSKKRLGSKKRSLGDTIWKVIRNQPKVIRNAKKFGESLCQSDSQLPPKWLAFGNVVLPISSPVCTNTHIIYIYIHTYTHTFTYIYIHIYVLYFIIYATKSAASILLSICLPLMNCSLKKVLNWLLRNSVLRSIHIWRVFLVMSHCAFFLFFLPSVFNELFSERSSLWLWNFVFRGNKIWGVFLATSLSATSHRFHRN